VGARWIRSEIELVLLQKARYDEKANYFQTKVEERILDNLQVIQIAAIHSRAGDESNDAGNKANPTPTERFQETQAIAQRNDH
jgi:hypothetical protein